MTIQPGVIVRMPRRDYHFFINGRLLAEGNATDSINFKGEWNSGLSGSSHGGTLYFSTGNQSSSLRFVSVDSLGDASNTSPYNVAIRLDAPCSIQNSTLRNSEGVMIYNNRSAIDYTNNVFFSNSHTIFLSDSVAPTIQNCFFNSPANISNIYANASRVSGVAGNTNAIIEVYGTIAQNCSWRNQGSNSNFKITPMTGVVVNANKVLTIEPGTRIISPYNGSLFINGTLIANGTETDSIYFIGGRQGQNATHGGYISVLQSSQNCSLSYISIDSLGYSSYPIYGAQNFSLHHSTIKNSWHISVRFANDTIRPTIKDCIFLGTIGARSISGSPSNFSNINQNTNVVIEPNGNLSQDAIWPYPGTNSFYKLNFSVNVLSGKILTIQPGVRVIMPGNGASININGTLIANGTASDSIYFIGQKQSNNFGGYLRFNTSSQNSSLSFVSIDSLGQDNFYNRALWVTGGLSIANSSIRNTLTYAIYADRSNLSLTQCNLSGQTGSAAIYLSTDTIAPTIQNCSFSGSNSARTIHASPGSISNILNNTNAIIELNGNVKKNLIWPNQGFNSVISASSVTVDAGKTLTIEPGNKIIFPATTSTFTVSGTLIAHGTLADSIHFSGTKTSSYNYGGNLHFLKGSSASSLKYVVIDSVSDQYFGYPAIRIYDNINITNSVIKNSYIWNAITIYSDTLSPTIEHCLFAGSVNNSRTIYASPGSISNLSDNINAVIELNGYVKKNSTWLNQGQNSVISANNVTIEADKTLTIQPGNRIVFPFTTSMLTVYGTLIANGPVTDSIHFSGTKNGSYGYSGTLQFQKGSSASSLKYVIIDSVTNQYWGYSAMRIYDNITVTKCNIKNSHNWNAITVYSDTISPIIQNCTFSGSSSGRTIYASPGSISKVSNNINAIIELNGNVKKNSTWLNQGLNSIVSAGNVTVDAGKTLTIEPGNKIVFPATTSTLTLNGTLIAHGTVADSIHFLGTKNSSYDYSGNLHFLKGSSASSLKYVVIDSVSNQYWGYPAMRIYDNISVTNSVIKNSYVWNAITIHSDTLSPTIQNCNFSGSVSARTIYAPSKCFSLITNNTNSVLRPYGDISSNTIWPKQSVNSYYEVDGPITINTGNVLTIEPGNLVNFSNTSSFLSVNGTLRAQGFETSPIQFLKLAGTGSGNFGGGIFLNANSSNHILNYCTFDKLGGYNGHSLDILTSNASISNISVSNSNSYGVYVANDAAPLISSSNITNNPTGVYVTSGKPVFNECNILANTSFGINNVSSATLDSVDARNCYWGHSSGPKQTTLNPLGQGNQVSLKVKFNPWKSQPTSGTVNDIGVTSILKPSTDCGLSSTDSVRIRLTNYGNVVQTNISVAYRINNNAPINEIAAISLLPGASSEYSFVQRVDLSTPGNYQILAYTSLHADSVFTNDTIKTAIQHLAGVTAPTNLLPTDNANNLNLPLTLNWSAVPNADVYDLFVWKASDTEPSSPTFSNLTQISYALSASQFQFGTAYKWKVRVRRANCIAISATQGFSTRPLPDLLIDSVIVPATAVSETDIPINWRTRNAGAGNTGTTQWNEAVYLSDQPVLGSGEQIWISNPANFSALDSGQSYPSSTINYRIPQGMQGIHYVIVETNSGNSVRELKDTNNITVSRPINISLAPPPDLQITNLIVSPLNTFSEDSVTVTFTIQNLGTGPTTTVNWNDGVFISASQIFAPGTATLLFSQNRNQQLLVNGSYTITKKIKLPAQISGTQYIHVFTDRFNQVFEYTKDDNNTKESLPLNIILRPTPNLIVESISVSADTLANNQSINLQWTVNNDGAITAKPNWVTGIYYSTSPVFNSSTAFLLITKTFTDSLASLGSAVQQTSVQLPNILAEGNYYFFAKADLNNVIFESPNEADNTSPASADVVVRNPDFDPSALSAPSTALSEEQFSVSWTVKNQSRAGVYNINWIDRVYLSTDNTFNGGDVQLASVSVSQLVAPTGSYSSQATVQLPVGISGNYYLLIVSDATNRLYEKLETNNVFAVPIQISIAPWADLQGVSVNTAPTDTVATQLNFQYTAKNFGLGNIQSESWTDSVYLSSTNNINSSSKTFIGVISQNRSIATGDSYSQSGSFLIPSSVPPGNYYLLVVADATKKVFENTNETNNRFIGNAISLANIPAIDLSIVGGQVLTPSITAGQNVSLQWTAKNNSSVVTIASPWSDGVYLSSNAVLDASDLLLASYNINGPLTAGSTYTQTKTVTIPNGVSGTVYLLATTDRNNVSSDPNRGNNTLVLGNGGSGQSFLVTVPPPADLIIPNLSAPGEATVAQPMSFTYTVKNNGQGSTPSGNWIDRFYLSTDYQLTGADIYLGSATHSGSLAPNADYTANAQIQMPSTTSGNYILIVKTDADNSAYEGNENNNIAFSTLSIKSQLPNDLLVTEVTAPASAQTAGNTITLKWKLKNAESNTALGSMKEAVYLSKDSIMSDNDVLFGTINANLNLPSQATLNRELTGALNNVSVDSYYVLVRTDILNNIIEQNEANNISSSPDAFAVTVKELPFYVWQQDTLLNNTSLYYRLEVPDSLRGETTSVLLKGDSLKNAVNRLFVSHGKIPKANEYDYAAAIPFKANQEAIIPDAKSGTYYLSLFGNDTATNRQAVQLFARNIPFSIASVTSNKGGNAGMVTVQIAGARFEPNMAIELVAGISVTAQNLYYVNSTKLYASFNLSGVPLGNYTVKLTKGGGATTQLINGFEVVKASPGGNGLSAGVFTCRIENVGYEMNIETDVLAPASTRPGNLVKITIAYANNGNVDIPVPKRMLLSLDGAPVNFVPYFDQNLQELLLKFGEEDGPPDILRASASGFIHIYTRATAPLSFIVTE